MLLYSVVLLLIGYVLRCVSCCIVSDFLSVIVLVMYCCMFVILVLLWSLLLCVSV